LDLDSRDDYIQTTWLGGGVFVALQTGGYKNCTPPSSAIQTAKICTPGNGATVSSPVQIRAAGNSPEGIIQLQVWIDGLKKAVRWSDQMNNRFALSPGKHRIAVVAMDKWYLSSVQSTINVTVK
jgi:enamine deaminase RidA (YjgF/YER057c/UK114 family)